MTEKKVTRAGMIPYVIENGEVLMMFMKPSDTMYGGDKFQIAKGKVDPGETPDFTAVRESCEELGLVDTNIEHTFYVGVFMGRTHVYVGRLYDRETFVEPCHETSETAWMTINEFLADGRDIHRPVIMAAHTMICNIAQLPPRTV